MDSIHGAPPSQTGRGYGMNFTPIFFERRFVPWLNGGVTAFQIAFGGTIFLTLELVPLVFGNKAIKILALIFILFDAVVSGFAAWLVDQPKRFNKTQGQWLIDVIKWKFSPRHIVNGRTHLGFGHRFRSPLGVERDLRGKHDAIA